MNGIVIKSTGSWYQVIDKIGNVYNCRIKGKFRIQGIKTTNPLAVGDNVEFSMEQGNENGIITIIHDRKNYIIRKSINLSKQAHIIAANIDSAFLIITVANPRTSYGFIDRFLITAEAYRVPTTLVFNKTDLLDANQRELQTKIQKKYHLIGYEFMEVSATEKTGIESLKKAMTNKINLLSGHSGVGKSTLINSIQPGLDLKTSAISIAHGKGTHTTTFAEMFPLDFGGFIIDTPGIKELGLVDMKKEELSHYFPEMRELLNKCQFNNCLHINEPKCAVKNAVKDGGIAESRYESYLSILSSDELKPDF